ncbi:hypothetical protein [Flavobacterium columnare]|uniref:hypothetical protein n=1 Tax=Flavobacterium columnare TaxID=996 RepID=UPI0013D1D38E|nr:hypothetical protein [Flavobacterium columnare]
MLNARFLHKQNYTEKGKIVAILDAGFLGVNIPTLFVSLHNKKIILVGYDFVKDSNNFYKGNSHETNILFIMGVNTTNLIGTVPDPSYYLFITKDFATEKEIERSNGVETVEKTDRFISPDNMVTEYLIFRML